MSSNLKKNLVFSGLLTASILAATVAYQFGGAARTYLDASPDTLESERPVAKTVEDVVDNLKKGRRVEVRRTVGDKTSIQVIEGSLPIIEAEHRFLQSIMRRRAKVRRKDYEAYVTKLVTMENVTLADMEREALMSHGALRAEYELRLFENGDFLVIDDDVLRPPVPQGWNWTRYNRMYRVNNQWRAMVTMYDPKKAQRLENEYRRYTNLADSGLDEWARKFNRKTVTERKALIKRQNEINDRLQELSAKNKNEPAIKKEWVSLWHDRSPHGIRFDEASYYAMLQQ